jgi:MoaA/NifB/PqqE/SkfB family radical SAM enzyme
LIIKTSASRKEGFFQKNTQVEGKMMEFNFFRESASIKNSITSLPGIGYLDRVVWGGSTLTMEGWGLVKSADGEFKIPDRFFVYYDSHCIGYCFPNISRPDVCKAYTLPDSHEECGFQCKFSVSDSTGLENRISVHFESDGDMATLSGPYSCIFPILGHFGEYNVNSLEGLAISLTTRCDLRCGYCFIQYPNYICQDIEQELLEKLFLGARRFSVKEIHYGIMGEPRVSKKLTRLIKNNIADGFRVSMASNFARPLTDEELEVFSSMHCIEVSIDTFDIKHLKAIRGADSLHVLMNLCKLLALARLKGQMRPDITFSVVCNELNIPDLPQLVGIAATIGVHSIQLLDMRKPYQDADFSSLPPRITESDKKSSLHDALLETLRICNREGISVSIDSIIKAFLDEVAVPEGAEFEPNSPDKPTRLCIAPWSRMYVYPDGNVTPCYHFSSVGRMSTNSSLDDCVNGPRMRSLRKELLSGDLVSGCQDCCRASPCTVEELSALVSQYTGGTRVRAETFGQPVDFSINL